MPERERRVPLVAAGLAVAVIGLIVGGGLRFAAAQRLDDAVTGLARATVGCETVLDFDIDGEYIVFIETRGRIDDVRGDCDVADEFEWDGADDDTPSATLTLTDPNGEEMTLRRRGGLSYDSGGFAGTSVRSVVIDEGGDHTLRVVSDDDEFAVAVGRDPNDGVGALRFGAVLVGVTGLLGGLILVVVGLRRGRSSVAATWTWEAPPPMGAGWPSSPPGFPAPPPTTGTSAAVGPMMPPRTPPAVSPASRPPTTPLPVPPLPSPPHRPEPPSTTRWEPPMSPKP